MSLNEQQNEEIRNILSQLQKQAREVTRDLGKSRVELGNQVRIARQSTLTLAEIDRLSSNDGPIKFYQPVGKMFMLDSKSSIQDELKSKKKSAEEEVTKLISKIKSLEAEVEVNQRALKEVVRSIDLESTSL